MEDRKRIRLARVFVSSTFQDMQAERDALNRDVLPQVQFHARRLGIEVILVDLRWGITKEQAEQGQTAALCLEEIDECRPFFLGLIGDRYGWIPTGLPDEMLNIFDWIRDGGPRSITEIEMEHGAFRAARTSTRAAFLIKEAPKSCGEELRRRSGLVSRVKTSRYPYSSYQGIERFTVQATYALCDMITAEFGALPKPRPFEAEDEGHDWFLDALARGFVGRPEAFQRLNDFIACERGILLLTGEPGCGKSSLLAAWASSRPPTERVIVHFSEAAPGSNWRDAALRIARLAAGEAYAANAQGDSEIRCSLRAALGEAAAHGRVSIILDGAEKLDAGDAGFDWLPDDLPDGVHIIIAANGESALRKLGALSVTRFHLGLLSPEEKTEACAKHLDPYAKTLDAEQLARIRESECCGNPLFLSTLLGELRLLGNYDQLNQTLERYLSAGSIDSLFDMVLERFARSYLAADHVLPVLACVGAGIAEDEMIALLGVRQMDWSRLRLALRPYLFGGALVRFASDSMRQAARRRYFRSGNRERDTLRRVAAFFENIGDDRRSADILPEVYLSLSDMGALLALLGRPDALHALRNKGAYRCAEFVAAAQNATGRLLADIYSAQGSLLAERNPASAYSVAECLVNAGDCAVSRKILLALHARAKEEDDKRSEQMVCGLLGRICHKTGEFAKAERYYNQKHDLCAQIHDELEQSRALGNLGMERYATGDLDGAHEAFDLARGACRAMRYTDGEQTALGNLANISLVRGDNPVALDLYREQRRLCVLSGNPFGLAAAIGGEGIVALRTGDDDLAASLFEQQASACVRCSYLDGEQTAIGNLALVRIKRGDLDEAEGLLERKYLLSERCGNAFGMSAALYNLSRIAELRGQLDRALEMSKQRVGLLKSQCALEQLGEAQLRTAILCERLGDTDDARVRALEAVAFGSQCGQQDTAQQAGLLLARLDQASREKSQNDF